MIYTTILTILFFPCIPGDTTINIPKQNLNLQGRSSVFKNNIKKFRYMKIPTDWVKITKKSN